MAGPLDPRQPLVMGKGLIGGSSMHHTHLVVCVSHHHSAFASVEGDGLG